MTMVEAGNTAPAFKGTTDGDGTITLKNLKGKKFVLYFYPKDMTPGCTTEAKDFTALASQFADAGVAIGVAAGAPVLHARAQRRAGRERRSARRVAELVFARAGEQRHVRAHVWVRE